jgi:hypothetical protein
MYQEEQAKDVLDGLLNRLRLIDKAFPASPEVVANELRGYQMGLADGVLRTAPELAPELARRTENVLCDPKATDTQLMVMARLMGDMPDLATSTGFDCIFKNRSKEDVVLWSALDAWRDSGLERTPGLQHLERQAVDKRTINRLQAEEPAHDDVIAAQAPRDQLGTPTPQVRISGLEAVQELAAKQSE